MLKARDAFFEIVDALKKEKKIKSTLEVEISTGSSTLLSMNATEAEDWFVVSSVNNNDVADEELGHFTVDGDEFVVVKATRAKCPRCWKFQAANEECVCERCAKVVNA
jgi:isoleucyl-tRNA synthetase